MLSAENINYPEWLTTDKLFMQDDPGSYIDDWW